MNKVDVLQVADVSIGRFSWWSNWIDVCVFDWSGYGYLLQMRVSRTNSKKFKATPFKQVFSMMAHPRTCDVGNLTQMGAKQ
jgi:hypothetical protein